MHMLGHRPAAGLDRVADHRARPAGGRPGGRRRRHQALAGRRPSPLVAAWLGPTKLATAILYATITNIVAYLPFLLLSGDTGRFMYSLPIVIGCSLVASRLVSMTFIPLLGLLPAPAEGGAVHRGAAQDAASRPATTGSARGRSSTAGAWPRRRCVLLVAGGAIMGRLKQQYFPKDLSYLFYVDVWLPGGRPARSATDGPQRRRRRESRQSARRRGTEARRARVGDRLRRRRRAALLGDGRRPSSSRRTTRRSSSR